MLYVKQPNHSPLLYSENYEKHMKTAGARKETNLYCVDTWGSDCRRRSCRADPAAVVAAAGSLRNCLPGRSCCRRVLLAVPSLPRAKAAIYTHI